MIKMLMKLFMSKKQLFDVMTYRVKSSKEILKVIDKMTAAFETHKFSLLHDYIYHEVLDSKGFPIERKV